MENTYEIVKTILIGIRVATFLLNSGRVLTAIALWKECLILLSNKAMEKAREFVKPTYIWICLEMLKAYELNSDHTSGIECSRKLLVFLQACGESDEECKITFHLAKLYVLQNKFKEAKELYKKPLIATGTGERIRKACCYEGLCYAYKSLCKYGKAVECLNEVLVIIKDIGNREDEANCYGNLGTLYQCLGEYSKAEESEKSALVIRKEIGHRKGEAASYGNLGNVYRSLGEYGKAEKYQMKALVINKEIGHKEGKLHVMETLGLCMNVSVNMARL